MMNKLLATFFIATFISCSRYVSLEDDDSVAEEMTERLVIPSYVENPEELLDEEISLDQAVFVALLNNPEISAYYEEIGISRADLWEATLLPNPLFDLIFRYPESSGEYLNIEYYLAGAIVEAMMVPLKTRLSIVELEIVKLEVSKKIFELAMEVRKTYAEMLFEREILSVLEGRYELTKLQDEILRQQARMGNIFTLEEKMQAATLLELDIEIKENRAELKKLKEHFHHLLGLKNEREFLLKELQDEMSVALDQDALECWALENRFEVKILRFKEIVLRERLGIKAWWTYSDFHAGLAGERESNGKNLLGFQLTGKLPIFNYGQAARAKIYAELRQICYQQEALQIQISSEIRKTVYNFNVFKELIEEEKKLLLPLEAEISSYSEELYNAMGFSISNLLETKKREFLIKERFFKHLKTYWNARVELSLALGAEIDTFLSRERICE